MNLMELSYFILNVMLKEELGKMHHLKIMLMLMANDIDQVKA
jgi:hypothetical protein